MDSTSCFIVEDDPQALEYASLIINTHTDIDILGHSDSIQKAYHDIKELQPDFILLDVFLTDGTAFDFLSLFDEINFKIVFTTSFAKYAIDAFKFNAIDYLLKPYEEKELLQAIDKVNKEMHLSSQKLQINTLLENLQETNTTKKIILKNTEAIHVVKTTDIMYAKSDNNYTTFYLHNGKEILVSKPLKSFDQKLRSLHFLRVHQSFLINLAHISSYNKKDEQIILHENHHIPVAQSKKKDLLAYMDTLF